MQIQLHAERTSGTVELVSMEIVMPVMNMVVVTDTKITTEMNMVVGKEWIITNL